MSDSPLLGLPYLAASQAQKHVTHNEALSMLDGLVHLAVTSRALATPPPSPTDGARYLIAPSPTGDWAGHAGQVALRMEGAWAFFTPREGWRLWVADEDVLIVFDGTSWSGIGTPGELQNVSMLGVNATADATNKLAVASAATLLNHVGNGHQVKINKNAAGDTAALLFQTGFSGRAELGTAGDDDFHFKVSPDGSAWTEAMKIDRTSGAVAPKSLRHALSNQPIYSFMPVPGAGAAVELYRINDTCGAAPRTANISSVASDVITLTAAVAGQFFNPGMEGFSLVRIWNKSKSPWQPAWVEARPSTTQLRVSDATAISGWAASEQIQIGDDGSPAAAALSNIVSLDVSPIMTSVFGASFRQAAAVLTASIVSGATAGDAIGYTPSGVVGTVTGLTKVFNNAMSSGVGTSFVSCSELSPVSNSNLLKIQESIAGTIGTRLVRMSGLFV